MSCPVGDMRHQVYTNVKMRCAILQEVTRTCHRKESGTAANCAGNFWMVHKLTIMKHVSSDRPLFSDVITESWRSWRRTK